MPTSASQALNDSDDPFAVLRQRYAAKRSDKVGSVGLASKTAASSYPTSPKDGRIASDNERPKPDLSDLSDDGGKRSDRKKPNNINAYPTYPTYPTENEGVGTGAGLQASLEAASAHPKNALGSIPEHEPASINRLRTRLYPNLRDCDLIAKIDSLSELIETHPGDSLTGYWQSWRAHFEAVLRTRY